MTLYKSLSYLFPYCVCGMVSVKCYKQSDCRVRERCVQLNRVKAVEKEKDDLETVKNEAVEYLQMENDIVTKKNVLFQKYMSVFS